VTFLNIALGWFMGFAFGTVSKSQRLVLAGQSSTLLAEFVSEYQVVTNNFGPDMAAMAAR
jgi:hypothetical protein